MNVSLSTIRRTLLGVQLVLIFPAALFMASLLMRDSQEPAHTAQRIVLWYSGLLRTSVKELFSWVYHYPCDYGEGAALLTDMKNYFG